jgi:lipoate-protein ligase B
MPSPNNIGLVELDVVPYGQALALQYQLRDRLIEGTAPDDRAGYLLCLEHPPTVTLGKRALPEHLTDRDGLREQGIEVFEIDRGGEATYHGPGQLVIYPIIQLEALNLGVVDVVRGLAAEISSVLDDYGVTASYDTDHPGVWVDDQEPKRKIASVGMRVRRGVSTHGAAINLVNDMTPFTMIVPCGMANAPMARLVDFVDEDVDASPTAFRERLYDGIAELTGAELEPVAVELPADDKWVESAEV